MSRAALLLLGWLGLATSACMPDVRPDSYAVGSVGTVNRTVAAIVISARPVAISGTSDTGGTTGALAGGVAGSSLGSNSRDNAIGALGGALVGAIAGAAIERQRTEQTGTEYVVQTDNGALLTIVQGDAGSFAPGAHVLVLYGAPSRIIADPRGR